MTGEPIIVETTFEVDVPPEEAYAALSAESQAHEAPEGRWWLPGWESTGIEVDATAGKRLELIKAEQPCKDTTIVLTFDHTPTGSRIQVVQSGFDPAFVEFAGKGFWRHSHHIFSDLEIFFRTGIVARRAWRPWAPFGFDDEVHSYGIEVTRVDDDGWAQRAGLEPGDVLVLLAGVPVFDFEDLAVLRRAVGAGDEVEVTWIRGSEKCSGSAVL